MEGLQTRRVEDETRQAEVERVFGLMMTAAAGEIRQMAELLVSKEPDELFGRTEFQLREIVLKMGARAIEAVLEDQKKGGT